ncbi:MAG: LptF/LptG family permease [Pseudomonadota bacterium]
MRPFELYFYIFRQLIGPFLFFCLIIGGVLWIAQALRISDLVVENGQPASVFLELSSLVMPIALKATLPIAGFAAAVYVTHRLISDTELTVMLSSGNSLLALSLPYLIFGFFVFVLMQLLLQLVLTSSTTRLLDSRHEIATEFVTQIIQPGEFITEQGRFTFFFGDKGKNADVYEIMIEEQVGEGRTITHIARQGQVVKEDKKNSLLLIDGSIQQFDPVTNALDVIKFDTFSFDMEVVREVLGKRHTQPEEIRLRQLRNTLFAAPKESSEFAIATKEFHERWVVSLLGFLAPVLGMAALVLGGFGRGSLLWRVILGTAALFMINSFRGIILDAVERQPEYWLVGYAPVLLVAIICLAILCTETFGTRVLSNLSAMRWRFVRAKT